MGESEQKNGHQNKYCTIYIYNTQRVVVIRFLGLLRKFMITTTFQVAKHISPFPKNIPPNWCDGHATSACWIENTNIPILLKLLLSSIFLFFLVLDNLAHLYWNAGPFIQCHLIWKSIGDNQFFFSTQMVATLFVSKTLAGEWSKSNSFWFFFVLMDLIVPD